MVVLPCALAAQPAPQCTSLLQVEWKRWNPKKHSHGNNGTHQDEEIAPLTEVRSLLQILPMAALEMISAMLSKTLAPAFAFCGLWCSLCFACFAARSRFSGDYAGLEAFRKKQARAEQQRYHAQDPASQVAYRATEVAYPKSFPSAQQTGSRDVGAVETFGFFDAEEEEGGHEQHHLGGMSDDEKVQDTDAIGENMVISPEYYADLVGQLQVEVKAREELERKVDDLQQQQQKERAELESRIETLRQEKDEMEQVAEAGLEELQREFLVTEGSYREQVRLAQEALSRQASSGHEDPSREASKDVPSSSLEVPMEN